MDALGLDIARFFAQDAEWDESKVKRDDEGKFATQAGVANLPEGKLPTRLNEYLARGDHRLSATKQPPGRWSGHDKFDVVIHPATPPGIKTVGEGRRREAYDPELAETYIDWPDEPELRREKARVKEGLPTFIDDVLETNPDYMYRGISSEEFDFIRNKRIVQSKGAYNIGEQQQGLTYWSAQAGQAGSYANSFAPSTMKATFAKPAYVVVAKRVADENLRHVEGTGKEELGVNRAVDADEIVEIWRGRVAVAPSSDMTLVRYGEGDDAEYQESSGGLSTPTVVWEKVPDDEMFDAYRRPALDAAFDASVARFFGQDKRHDVRGGNPDNPGEFSEAPGGKKAEPLKGMAPNSHAMTISTAQRSAAQARSTRGDYSRIDMDAMRRDRESYEHNMNLLKNSDFYPNFKLSPDATPEEVEQQVIQQAADNLEWLYHAAPKELQDQGAQWYEGAHALAAEQAENYELPLQSVVGVYAALSPRKLWDMNVHLAERMLDIWHNNQTTGWTTKMDAAAERKATNAGKIAAARVKKAGYGAEDQQAAARRAYLGAKRDLDSIAGKRLDELTLTVDKARWIIAYDEAHGPKQFSRLSPDGRKLDTYRNDSGAPTGVVWQSAKITANAIKCIESDGDREKLSTALSPEKHKVRSFYNNILDPHSGNGDVTMDTHAVGAAMLQALGGDDPAVVHSLMSTLTTSRQPEGWAGASVSAIGGARGTYALWADAYREAARRIGVEPRVLQSVTWEAKRQLFSDTPPNAAANVAALWQEYHAGRKSLPEVRDEVLQLTGGWANKRPPGVPRHVDTSGRSSDRGDASARDRADPRELHHLQLDGQRPRSLDGRGRTGDTRGASGLLAGAVDRVHVALDALSAAIDREFKEHEHKRDDEGKFAKQAEASRSFVSPSIAEGLRFNEARQALGGSRQKALSEISQQIDRDLGLTEAQSTAVIGAWADGAENSLMTLTSGDPQMIRAAAAMKGAIAQQKAVLVFQPGEGDDEMASFAMSGDLVDIHNRLLQGGLAFHTLEPTEGGARVHILVQDDDTASAITEVAQGAEIALVAGTGEFVGTEKTDGTDDEQRSDAVRVYTQVIEEVARQRQDGGPDLRAVWEDANNYWRAATAGAEDYLDRGINKFFAHDRAFRESDVKRDDEGKFATQAGGGAAASEPTMNLPETSKDLTEQQLLRYRAMQSTVNTAYNRYGFKLTNPEGFKTEDTIELEDDEGNRIELETDVEPGQEVRTFWDLDVVWTVVPKEGETSSGMSMSDLMVALRELPSAKAQERRMEEHWQTERQRKITEAVTSTVKDLGYDPDKVEFSNEIKTFVLGDRETYYAGAAHIHPRDPKKGTIVIYNKFVTPESARGLAAHEVTHQKFQMALDDLEAEKQRAYEEPDVWEKVLYASGAVRPGYEEKYPLIAALEPFRYTDPELRKRMEKADGVTPYSRDWWQAYDANKATWEQAAHETLAEMAKLRREDPQWRGGSRDWRKLYNLVDRNYKKKHWVASDREFRESDVKRDDDGKFAKQAGSGAGNSSWWIKELYEDEMDDYGFTNVHESEWGVTYQDDNGNEVYWEADEEAESGEEPTWILTNPEGHTINSGRGMQDLINALDEEGIKTGEKETQIAEIRDAARAVAKQLDYDPEKIVFKDHGEVRSFADMLAPVLGEAVPAGPEQGKIILYTDPISQRHPSIVPAVTAHEVMHQKFQGALDLYRDKVEPVASQIDELMYGKFGQLQRDDGVTPYSTQFWQDYAANNVSAIHAIHETLAEMSHEQALRGKLPGSPAWRKLHGAVTRIWKQHYKGGRGYPRPDPFADEREAA